MQEYHRSLFRLFQEESFHLQEIFQKIPEAHAILSVDEKCRKPEKKVY